MNPVIAPKKLAIIKDIIIPYNIISACVLNVINYILFLRIIKIEFYCMELANGE
jgi:hypothetical protein